jgi:hypothetical protein
MNDRRGKELAGRVGKVEKMEVDDKGQAWGSFCAIELLLISLNL